MSAKNVLSLLSLSKRFGTTLANDQVTLDLKRGEILALLGENGAGKTTLMNMLFGHYLPDEGSILISNAEDKMVPLTPGHPQAALAAGIGMVHQHFTLAENLTALENITLGSEPLWALGTNKVKVREKIEKIIKRSGLKVDLNVAVGRLSVGEKQRVEILKALYRDAKILVLDEPTAVLTPQEADLLFKNIQAMTLDGLSVIFISHKLREVLEFSHRIVVLRNGKKVGEILTCDADEKIIANMMVGEDAKVLKRTKLKVGQPLLSLSAITLKGNSLRNSLSDISLIVHEHEVLGVAGVSGNGQSVLAELISGLSFPNLGEIKIGSNRIDKPSPMAMISAGIGRIPEDRHRDGIVGSMTVAENAILESLNDPRVQRFGFLRQEAMTDYAEKLCEAYDVRGPGVRFPARLLSGGNIQKLILARVFEKLPSLILANQPTRGLDLGAASDVERRLLDARNRGAGVILISEDLDELLRLSDRIMVMYSGELKEVSSRNREEIGMLMAGKNK